MARATFYDGWRVHSYAPVNASRKSVPFFCVPIFTIDSDAKTINQKMAGNKDLHVANKAKKDEFYTQLVDIENELWHYKEHFAGKTVLCNCDDPRVSNFFHYFSYKFEDLGLKQ